jgi:hypothetical protein
MKKLILILFSCIQTAISISQTVSIDFTKHDTVANMVGFLHATDGIKPNENLISPLKPLYWRAGPFGKSVYKRANKMGAKYIQIVSDVYGYPDFKDWTPPYLDTARFKSLIDKMCLENSTSAMIYDIWNEPDNPVFWSGGIREFYDIFKIAHDRLRKNLGDSVEISGPSTNIYNKGYLLDFCNFCLQNKIKLDVFSFHWIHEDHTQNLEEILLWTRANIVNNPVYAPLKIKKIVVSEILHRAYQFNPAAILSHYHYLEKGKADGACRACWDEQNSQNNCWNNTLNGLLTPDSYSKRSAWWATKAYAELDPIRYASTSSSGRVYSMVGNLTSDTNILRVLVGNNNNESVPLPPKVTVKINSLNKFSNFPADEKLFVNICKIPNTEDLELRTPVVIGQYVLSNKSASIQLPAFPMEENAVVYVDIISMRNIPAAINSASNDNKLLLFPNPSTNAVYIFGINNAMNYETVVYNSVGALLTKSKNNNMIDISKFPYGTYFIKIKQGSKIYHRKFIKK